MPFLIPFAIAVAVIIINKAMTEGWGFHPVAKYIMILAASFAGLCFSLAGVFMDEQWIMFLPFLVCAYAALSSLRELWGLFDDWMFYRARRRK